MEEAPCNGGLLYHEVQEGKLCAVHCLNTALQGPFFSEFDLAALAEELDRREQQVMMEGAPEGSAPTTAAAGDFLAQGEASHNVSLGGDFSIQVLQRALEVWNLQVIPLVSSAAGAFRSNPELETAFICHLVDHWFCIRRVNGDWYNFNSLYPAPEHLSEFYLSVYLDTLWQSDWSIFAVRGNFPKECPSDSSNGFGQWMVPDDAKRITLACKQVQVPTQQVSQSKSIGEMEMIASQQEEDDLKAALTLSLMGSDARFTGFGPSQGEGNSKDVLLSDARLSAVSKGGTQEDHEATQQPSQSESISEMEIIAAQQEEDDLKAAIAMSLMGSGVQYTGFSPTREEGNSKGAPLGKAGLGAVRKCGTQEEHGASKSETTEPQNVNTQETALSINPRGASSSLEEKESVKKD